MKTSLYRIKTQNHSLNFEFDPKKIVEIQYNISSMYRLMRNKIINADRSLKMTFTDDIK